MKKVLVSLIPIIIMIIVAVMCVLAYFIFTKEKKQENNQPKEISTEPIFTAENFPKIDASLATQPLTDAFYKNFTGQDIENSNIEYSNTHPGYVKLINGEVDLIVVTEPSQEELELAKKKGVELEVIPVVKEGFVFYVNNQNKITDLTIEQIQKIYSGQIDNWLELGGENESIRAFQRPENSGSQTGMLSLVMKNIPLKEPLKEDFVETMAEIINLVSDFNNGKGAIGYSYYYYATTMYEQIDENVANGIRLLKINGVEPNYDTIKNGQYPIQTNYYIVINKNEPQDSNTRKLVEAMLSDRGQAVAKEAGYVPVK